jgi:RHS repeat-associated protein
VESDLRRRRAANVHDRPARTHQGRPTYLHHDQIGSTRLLTEARGSAVGTFSYTPFGAPAGTTGTRTTPLGFAGEYSDAESGLQYLRARYLDPASGQFLTRDPLTSVSGAPYTYADDAPLAYGDPSGLFPSLSEIGMTISDAAAGALNELTFGISNRIAGVDGSCAGRGYGVGGMLAFAGTLLIPGGEAKLLEGAYSQAERQAGEVIRYKTFVPNPRSPHGADLIKRFDLTGEPHYSKALRRDVDTPHVHEPFTRGGVRPPEPWEIP